MSFLFARYDGSAKIFLLGATDTITTGSPGDGLTMTQSEIDSGKPFVFTSPNETDSTCN